MTDPHRPLAGVIMTTAAAPAAGKLNRLILRGEFILESNSMLSCIWVGKF